MRHRLRTAQLPLNQYIPDLKGRGFLHYMAPSTNLYFLSNIMVDQIKEVYHEHLGRIMVWQY